jgi:two-component sensor histidine kinase
VTDDGIGLPSELNILESNSLGLKVVNSLVHQLDGTIEQLSKPGATFKICFKPDSCEWNS